LDFMVLRSSFQFLFVLLGSAVRRQEEQLTFLEAGRRATAGAVNGAVLAFIGAKRRPLTGEARGMGAGFV
jgi:hypothetical protein